MKALVIGATGATGKDLVGQLLEDSQCWEVHIFVRRDPQMQHPKLKVHIVDFDQMEQWADRLCGDVLFSALGTTIRQARSQQAQWKVDHTYQHMAAQAARRNGVGTLVLVSSAMASAKSKVFYTRMKGRLEEDVKQLGFPHLAIMRPPSLVRQGSDRMGERLGVAILQALNKIGLLRATRPMPTSHLAHAMIAVAKQGAQGVSTLEPADIWKL